MERVHAKARIFVYWVKKQSMFYQNTLYCYVQPHNFQTFRRSWHCSYVVFSVLKFYEALKLIHFNVSALRLNPFQHRRNITLVPSMWFWSVSWSTNCPVFFSFFLVDQKRNCPVSGNFWSVSGNFWSTKFLFGIPKLFLVDQIFFGLPKIPRDCPKIPWDWTIFFWSTKKNEKKTGQLVDQETDQNHMDGTLVSWT